jgi:hypothetical protein
MQESCNDEVHSLNVAYLVICHCIAQENSEELSKVGSVLEELCLLEVSPWNVKKDAFNLLIM